MSAEKIFVGRKAELEQFKEILKNPNGQAVLVIGQAGMGKTWLVNKMAEEAKSNEQLKCGWIRYEVTPTDSPGLIMELMIDHAFDAARVQAGLLDKTPKRAEQFRTFLNLFGNVGDFVKGFKREQQRHIREQFFEKLDLISEWMPDNGRAIFIIDPEKYMQKDSDQSWAIVVKELPKKIKFVFPQRPEDELVKGRAFKRLKNVCYIPNGKLGALKETYVNELVRLRADDVGQTGDVLKKTVKRYKGHPYAIVGALEIVKKTKSVENLPQDPTPESIAEGQWERVCEIGNEAIVLFEAYAILEVGVPDDVVKVVSGLNATKLKRLQKDSYLKGLLRDEGEGKRIYHAILADYILGQIGEDEKKEYHSRAVEVYRGKLAKAKKEQIRPDVLAATRLAEHVLASEGEEEFVDSFVNECGKALMNLGFFDTFISLSEQALEVVENGSKKEAAALCNLGLIYITRGEFDKAEDMQNKSLEIEKKLGRIEEMASNYGNLGVIYQMKGDLDKAEDMYKKSFEINKKLGCLDGMADQYGNLGVIYRTKGDLDKAKDMLNKSLEIEKKLGRLEAIARQYGNLGLIYRRKGDLDKAEDMHNKSLEINKKLGSLEGMASDYAALGLVHYARGDLGKSEKMHIKGLEIDKKLDRLEGIARQYGNLGNVYQILGELDKAKEMYKKALEIDEKICHLEGVARHSANLGVIYKKRGDIDKAKEYWKKAVGLFKKIGMPHEVEKVQGWINGIEN